jgi:hypothetical protein
MKGKDNVRNRLKEINYIGNALPFTRDTNFVGINDGDESLLVRITISSRFVVEKLEE